MRHTPHQLLLFTWGGVACQADAADRQATSTCKGANSLWLLRMKQPWWENNRGLSSKEGSVIMRCIYKIYNYLSNAWPAKPIHNVHRDIVIFCG